MILVFNLLYLVLILPFNVIGNWHNIKIPTKGDNTKTLIKTQSSVSRNLQDISFIIVRNKKNKPHLKLSLYPVSYTHLTLPTKA